MTAMLKPTLVDAFLPATLLVLLTPQPATAAAGMSDMAAYLRLTWGLLIVLGIMLILYALVRKRFSLLHSPEKSAIKVLEIRHLMPKKSLCLIEVKGREYLLGISAENISLIASLSAVPENSFAAILENSSSRAES